MDTSGTDDTTLKGNLGQIAQEAMKSVPAVIDKVDEKSGDGDKPPVKILFFEVDPSFLVWFQTGYNVIAEIVAKILGPQVFVLSRKVLPAKSAAAVALGADVLVKGGGYLREIYSGARDDYQQKQVLAKKLAPILDEVKGNHSVAAMFTTTSQQNEMIYAQCQRIRKKQAAATFGRYVDLGVNAGPNILLSVPEFLGHWNTGQTVSELQAAGKTVADSNLARHLKDGVGTVVNLGVPQIAQSIKASREKKLEKTLPPYSALEMVVKLEEELGKNPGASAYSAPNGDSFSLEDYVAHIITQHSKDMSVLNPEYAEVRKALKPDVDAIAKPIAEAIKKGDLAPITLVRWVGEGKILKDKGRKLASAEEVHALLGKAEKAPTPPVIVNPKDYYMDASFNRKELKAALDSMKGNERLAFAAMFPDAVLTQAGVKEEEIKAVHAYMLNGYETTLAHTVAGLAAQSDEELTRDGLGKDEIKQLREAADALNSKGAPAIHELKTTHANTNGIERTVTNWAVPRVKSGSHLGLLVSKGRAQLAAAAANPKPIESKAKPDEDKADEKKEKSEDQKPEDKDAKTAKAAEDKTETKGAKSDAHEAADGHVAALQQKSGSDLSAEPAR